MNGLREDRSVTEFQSNVRSPVDCPDSAETVAAIRRGIKDADEGRMIPLETVATMLRAKHGL